jgi:hypothetical protein
VRIATCAVVAAVVVGVAAGAGCSGGDGASLTMDELAGAREACPVDVDAAVKAAGLDVTGATTEVDVTRGSGRGGPEDPPLDQAGGVYVECDRPVAGGEVTAIVVALDRPSAVNLLLPLIQRDADLDIDQLRALVERTARTDDGDLVDLGVDGPLVALSPIDVGDAESAVLYVSASVTGARPSVARNVAERLLDDL